MNFTYKSYILLAAVIATTGCDKEYNYNELICNNGGEICFNKAQEPISGVAKQYDNNNVLITECSYKQGKLDGKCMTYAGNGGILLEASLKKGNENGTFKKYSSDGKELVVANYKNGKLDGKLIEYFENGKIKKELNYTNGTPDGQWTEYDNEGNPVLVLNYKNGVIDGAVKKSENNNIFDANLKYGEFDGRVKIVNDNNMIEATFKNGKLDGEVKVHNKSNNDDTVASFNDNILEKYITLNNNNKVMEVFKTDVNDTYICKAYADNKTIFEKTLQINEITISPKGKVKEYYNSGNLKLEYTLNGRTFDGVYREYREDGTIKCQKSLKNSDWLTWFHATCEYWGDIDLNKCNISINEDINNELSKVTASMKIEELPNKKELISSLGNNLSSIKYANNDRRVITADEDYSRINGPHLYFYCAGYLTRHYEIVSSPYVAQNMLAQFKNKLAKLSNSSNSFKEDYDTAFPAYFKRGYYDRGNDEFDSYNNSIRFGDCAYKFN